MAAVLRHTVEKYCSDAAFRSDQIRRPPEVAHVRQLAPNNLAKICSWKNALDTAVNPMVMCDADTFVVNDVGDVWDEDFDVAYCWRPGNRPVIGGVIFARPTDAARRFMGDWVTLAAQQMLDPRVVECRQSIYGGPNQSALHTLTKNDASYADIVSLPANPWNLCDEVWSEFEEDKTKIVHLKGAVRQEAFAGAPPEGGWTPIVKRWLNELLEAYDGGL